ncbi:formimidoylglutamate deiminase [Streptomyces sp. BBFR102]|uniref:formimidoylglutamate deiminase n=1 Tax=Streptomyces sp. BBFR102 TaxID=3448171 RepID=UPI003F52FCE1
MNAFLLEHALLPDGVREDVLVEIEDGRFTAVTPGPPARGEAAGPDAARRVAAERVPGLTVPGLANAHSHAFHRVLRGRTQRARGTFWTWREQMYAAAERLDPDLYRDLATAVFREMAAAGFTTVGEFHYLHHQLDGRPYADPNAMGLALVDAARAAGLRIALLDTCYLSSGFGAPPVGVQTRYSDGDAHGWAERFARLREQVAGAADVVAGVAVHSVRAVPSGQLATVGGAADGLPLHVHLSEQTAENRDCLAATGRTPTQLLDDHGLLGPNTTAVHATHLTGDDIARLGAHRAFACFCATTERDLGDGIGPSRALHEAGARLSIGSDSHAVVDPFEDMRAVELDERLASRERGHWTAAELLTAGARHDSLGFPDAGRIAVGLRADLVTLDLCSPRTAGTGVTPETAVFAATAADVVRTMTDGRLVYRREEQADIGRALARSIARLTE